MDAVLFPLVGFDEAGGRLGMGGGFYDRTFAFTRIRPRLAPKLIGLAHDCQQVSALPVEPWDVPLHSVVTDKRRHWISRAGKKTG
jgi:5-formyltetrahydrofolate cyclo-ligase